MPEILTRPLARVALAVVLVLVGGGAVLAATRHQGLPADVAARVDGHDITRAGLTSRAHSLRALYGVQQPRGAKLASFRRDLAKAEVLSFLVDRAAARRGVTVSSAQAGEALDRYVAQQYGKGATGQAAFAQALADAGTSQPQVLAEIRRQLLVSKLYDDVTKAVPAPTKERIATEFAKRRCVFTTGPQRRLANLVVATRQDAVAALDRVRAGEDFGAVARSVSLDGSSAAAGGELGYVGRDQLEKGYGALAFSTRVGGLFGPVHTRHGWNVGRVEGARKASAQPEAQAERVLADVLRLEDRSRAWRDWVGTVLKRADTQYAPAYRPAHPDAPPAGMSRSLAPAGGSKDCSS